jgi:pectate lyase
MNANFNMLLGASDADKQDQNMRVTIFRNWFKDSMQRMPHCRYDVHIYMHTYIHTYKKHLNTYIHTYIQEAAQSYYSYYYYYIKYPNCKIFLFLYP